MLKSVTLWQRKDGVSEVIEVAVFMTCIIVLWPRSLQSWRKEVTFACGSMEMMTTDQLSLQLELGISLELREVKWSRAKWCGLFKGFLATLSSHGWPFGTGYLQVIEWDNVACCMDVKCVRKETRHVIISSSPVHTHTRFRRDLHDSWLEILSPGLAMDNESTAANERRGDGHSSSKNVVSNYSLLPTERKKCKAPSSEIDLCWSTEAVHR